MSELSITEFIKQRHDDIDAFFINWDKHRAVDPYSWPVFMRERDWYEQEWLFSGEDSCHLKKCFT